MNIQKMQYFCSVAKHLSFSKAADEYHMAQTAMSRHIQNLEEELGFKLFFRDHHTVELTPAGRFFLTEAERIIDTYNTAKVSAIEISKGSTEIINIGFGGFDQGFAYKYCNEFAKTHQDCSLILNEYSYESTAESLISQTSDIVFTSTIRVKNKDFIKHIILSDSRYVICVGPGHRLYDKEYLVPEDLNGETFICPVDSKIGWQMKDHLTNIFRVYNITPAKITRSNSSLSILNMLRMGVGVTFLSEDVDQIFSDIKKLQLISPNACNKRHSVACLKNNTRPVVNEFMEFIRKNRPEELK